MLGQSILHYNIIEKLGEGGMGVVYLAEDTRLGRNVAIKFLPDHIANDSESRERFVNEAKAAAALNHPNIAQIYAIENSEDAQFIVMEYVDGNELFEAIRESPLHPEVAIDYANQIANGLHAAHEKGIIHRDIKPTNIMITGDGQMKIMDFGLAKMADAALKTRQGTTLGTFAYMSPEQAQGMTVDYRTDIWSLGVVFYQMIAGKAPFEGDYEQVLIYAILNESPEKLAETRPEIPAEIDAIIEKALAKNPDERFATMAEMIAALKAIQSKPGKSAGETKLPKEDPQAEQIGPYKIRQQIGEGGMGEVYLAEQIAPVRRKVALKIIKLGMDSKQIVARFEAERQALAVMDHPNIAKVFEAGTTDKGRPYFVMEYVPGVPLNSYCDTERLSTNERLELFTAICGAVQHAHQKGVIHRDLKPSNILVSLQDGKPVPKIIDFGIAKAIHTPLTDSTLVTAIGEVVGTPAYMSPEQLENSQLDIDTRSDIYSLGVILFELLAGALPFDFSEYQKPGDSLQKMIRETDPPTPSKRLQTIGDVREKIARNRRTDAGSLHKKLAGDLDWITVKAMEKDRNRRYETANGLAMDIRRYLNDEPVFARPPSAGYRISKFVRRNRLAVIAAGVAVSGLLIGFIFATAGFVRATQAEQKASREAESARQVSNFLIDLFKISDPTEAVGDTISARQLLDRSAERIGAELKNEPVIQARLMHTMGKVYSEMGLFGRSKPLLDSALAKQRALLDTQNPELGATLHDLGYTYYQLGEFDSAQVLMEQSLQIFRENGNHEKVVQNLRQLGDVWEEKGDQEKQLNYHQESVEYAEQTIGKNNIQYAESVSKLSFALANQGKYEAAEPLVREALRIAKAQVGDDHWLTSRIKIDLAWWLLDLSRNDEAVQLFNEALETFKKIYGPDHPETAIAMSNLASTYTSLNRHEEAIELHKQAVTIFKKRYGNVHYDVATAMNNYGRSLVLKGDYDAAEKVLWEVVSIYETLYGKDTPRPAAAYTNLGRAALAKKDFRRAEEYLKKAVAMFTELVGDAHPVLSYPMFELAKLKTETGDVAAAEVVFRQVIALREAAFGEANEEVLQAQTAYAALLRQMNRPAAADSVVKRVAEMSIQN